MLVRACVDSKQTSICTFITSTASRRSPEWSLSGIRFMDQLFVSAPVKIYTCPPGERSVPFLTGRTWPSPFLLCTESIALSLTNPESCRTLTRYRQNGLNCWISLGYCYCPVTIHVITGSAFQTNSQLFTLLQPCLVAGWRHTCTVSLATSYISEAD